MAIQIIELDPDAAGLADQSVPVRNETGSTLDPGDLVYVSGWNAGTDEFLVDLAEAPSNDAHLAQFIMRASLTTAASGFAFKSFALTGQDTSASVVGDPIYLSDSTPGGFTEVRPSFAQQIIGRVSVVNAVTGEIEFLMLADSDSGFIRSNPSSGEFPVSAMQRNAAGNVEIEFDDVAI